MRGRLGSAGFFGTFAAVVGDGRTDVGGVVEGGGGGAGAGATGRLLGELCDATAPLRPYSLMPFGVCHRLGSGGVKSSGGRFCVATRMKAPQMRAG